jgi:transposase
MGTDEKIADFLARAETRPAPSKLEPYHELIRTLRQRRWTYKEIAAALRVEFGVSAAPSTIHAFIKVRAQKKKVASLVPSNSESTASPPDRKPRFRLDV